MAKMSPIQNIGRTIPVDNLLSNNSAKMVTTSIPKPLIPDLEIPIKNAANPAIIH